jgi:hypothetical protein
MGNKSEWYIETQQTAYIHTTHDDFFADFKSYRGYSPTVSNSICAIKVRNGNISHFNQVLAQFWQQLPRLGQGVPGFNRLYTHRQARLDCPCMASFPFTIRSAYITYFTPLIIYLACTDAHLTTFFTKTKSLVIVLSKSQRRMFLHETI